MDKLTEKIEEIKSLLYNEHYITGGYIDSLDALALLIARFVKQRELDARIDELEYEFIDVKGRKCKVRKTSTYTEVRIEELQKQKEKK